MRIVRVLLVIVAVVCLGVALSYPIRYRQAQEKNDTDMEKLVELRQKARQEQQDAPDGAAETAVPWMAGSESTTSGDKAAPDAGRTSGGGDGAGGPADGISAPAKPTEGQAVSSDTDATEEGDTGGGEENTSAKPADISGGATGADSGRSADTGGAAPAPQMPDGGAAGADSGRSADTGGEATTPQTPDGGATGADSGQSADVHGEVTFSLTPADDAGAPAGPEQPDKPTPTPVPTPEPTPTPQPFYWDLSLYLNMTPEPTPEPAEEVGEVIAEPTPDLTIRKGPLPYALKEKVVLDEAAILPDLKEIYALNHDLVGWLTIPDTVIDYPVVQADNGDYYLSHDFYGEENINGQIILDILCDPYTPSYNLVISGHHMKNGSMFGGLPEYQNKGYWEKHRFIEFETLMERRYYVVFACFYSADYDEDEKGFRYNAIIDYKMDADRWLEEIEQNQLYDTGIDREFGDEFITLTTCNRARHRNGRFVVVCRKIREGETFE